MTHRQTDLILHAFPASSNTFWLCMANSLVGARTNIIGEEETPLIKIRITVNDEVIMEKGVILRNGVLLPMRQMRQGRNAKGQRLAGASFRDANNVPACNYLQLIA